MTHQTRLKGVVPKADGPCQAGYIYAFLGSPLGQAQFNGVYGAVVDELTADDASNILIPVPETPEQKAAVAKINALALDAMGEKEAAIGMANQAVDAVSEFLA